MKFCRGNQLKARMLMRWKPSGPSLVVTHTALHATGSPSSHPCLLFLATAATDACTYGSDSRSKLMAVWVGSQNISLNFSKSPDYF
mmetsp:Transcript_47838/g.93950  ORF Transcript_47838/g.93950 Transcript_47838/m.93950 type:complete len:86 (+) Transcript_47838:66-323(+)